MTHLKLIAKLFMGFMVFAMGLLLGWNNPWNRGPNPPAGTFHSGLTIERFADLSELLVTRIDVSDVLVSSIQGRTGGVQIVLMVKGDVSIGIDLSAAHFDHVDNDRRTAVLVLPPPGPPRPRLDHALTRTVLIEKEGLWLLTPGTRLYCVLVDQAMKEAQALVSLAGATKDADSRARAHAEAVLRAFFRSLDWKVQINWADRS